MKILFASAAFIALTAGTALAADPIGDWLVKDGYAHIRIADCAGKLWGIVAWEKEAGMDNENPDPAKKGRPILGMPILLGMKPTPPNKWEGEIYNSQNGKMYSANISMVDDNTLKLQGCVFGGLFCGGENWTRVTTPPANSPPLPPVPGAPPAPPAAQAKKGAAAAKGNPQAAVQNEVCTRVAAEMTPANNTPANNTRGAQR